MTPAKFVAAQGPVVVRGAPADFDVYNAPTFREQLVKAVQAGHYRIVVDLSAVVYCDSTGLGVLGCGLKRTRRHEGWLRLAAPQDKLRRVLDSTGLNRVFDIFGTVEAAIDHQSEGIATL